MNARTLAIAYLVGLTTGGCAADPPVMSSAFDSLTSESVSESTALMNYRTFISISGLAPPHVVGMMVHSPGTLSPGHAIGISPKWSFFLESDYSAPSGATGVASARGVRALYLNAQASAAKVAETQLLYAVADRSLTQAGQKATAAEQTEVLNAAAQALAISCPGSCDMAAIKQAKTDLKSRLDTAIAEAKTAASALDEAVDANNVIITRWTGGVTSASNVSIAFVNAGETQTRQLTGIAIFRGIHTRYLFAGEDFLDMVNGFTGKGTGTTEKLAMAGLLSQASIASFVVMADEVEYISDQELQQQISLGASIPLTSIQALKAMLKADPTLAKLDLDATRMTSTVLGNSGRLGHPSIKTKGFCFWPPPAHQDFLLQQMNADNKYVTVFAIRSQLKLYETMLAARFPGKTDLGEINSDDSAAKWLQHCVDYYQANENGGVQKKAANIDVSHWRLPLTTHAEKPSKEPPEQNTPTVPAAATTNAAGDVSLRMQ